MKTCTRCKENKDSGLFKIAKANPDGRSSWCKKCHSAQVCDYQKRNREKANKNNSKYHQSEKGHIVALRYKRSRRMVHRMARPAWFDRAKVDAIYADAKLRGLHVDHIVPLQSPLVCGLHVQHNLVAIDNRENKVKGNRYWPDGPHFELAKSRYP